MKLEDQVCSLELSKRLRELGAKQESAFYWCGKELQIKTALGYSSWGCEGSTGAPDVVMDEEYDEYWDEPAIAAFTVAELGEMLPEFFASYKFFKNDGSGPFWKISDDGNPDTNLELDFGVEAHTEADCKAKMLIYLIEQGIVTPTISKQGG